jgi:S1-C subfamily serine protease
LAKHVATQLITSGKVARAWLGISGISITRDLAEGLNLGVQEGVLIVQVVRGSPAYQAKLKGGRREVAIGGIRLRLGGDIITGVDEQKISDMKQLVRLLNKMRVGQTLTLHILRDGIPREVNVLLAESPGID